MRPGRIYIGWLLAFCASLSLAACGPSEVASEPTEGSPSQPSTVGETGSDQVAIFVTSNGWHSEIVVPRALLPAGAIPEVADFPDAAYFSFGWGDETYYPAPRKTIGMTLSAAILPTPSVVHLAGLQAHPSAVFPADEVVELRLTREGFRHLVTYLDGSFARQAQEPRRPVTPGLYRFSRFYPATGKFHLFNTCNTWTARGLQQGGLSIQVFGTLRAEDLMAQVRELSTDRNARKPAAVVN